MSSKFNISKEETENGLKTGVENIDIPDFDIPSCGIEDVDRALFKLFNEDIPFFYEKDGDLNRIPTIFASGERAFVLRKQQPLRDRQGALILPLISILRNGIEQEVDKRPISQGDGELTIKRRIAPENVEYKKLLASKGQTQFDLNLNSNNIYEFITIPTPRFFKSTYEVTFWTTYLQTMNHMLEAFMSSYNNDMARSFRIESPKGYWFVAYVEGGFSDGGNADGYVDEERLIKTTVTITVTGYIINPKFPGAPNNIRRYISAPNIEFEVKPSSNLNPVQSTNVLSGNPNNHTFDQLLSDTDPQAGDGVAKPSVVKSKSDASIGGEQIETETQTVQALEKIIDPFSNSNTTVKVKNLSKGETIYRNITN